jgi:ubiquinone/menaquinone biosynthesis C-methylase UbiE
MRPLDAAIEAGLRLARRLPVLDPLATGLGPHRRRAAERIAARLRPHVAAIADAVAAHEPAAVEAYDALVAAAVERLRAERPAGPLRALAALDRLLYRNDPELLDDPSFPERERIHVLDVLDRFNRHLGSYERWMDLAETLVARAEAQGRSPVRVWDLAAGHGGFPLALKERLGDRVEATATDLRDEYLELGRQCAARRGLDVRFVPQDATDLASVHDAGVDVFLCTQSLHHFPPGMVARMIGEAARVARTGLCFIDAERGFVPMALVPAVMAAYGRAWPVVHDTVVSLRRMYLVEELWLLAALAPALPEACATACGRRSPGFGWIQVTRS